MAQASPAASAKDMADALRLRTMMAEGIGQGTEKPVAALARLKSQGKGKATGLKLEADADFAYAAIDVGRRLIAAGKPKEAEDFFKAAQQSLEQLVKRTPNTRAKDKAQFLRKLALIRSEYLNQAEQARLDMDQAIALQPEDRDLQRARKALPNPQSEVVGRINKKS